MSEPESTWRKSPCVVLPGQVEVGERYRTMPPPIAAMGRSLLESLTEDLPKHVEPFVTQLRRVTEDRFQEEFIAVAEAIGVPWEQIAVANLSYDVAIGLFGCSTIVLPANDGPVVARNMDWPRQDVLARCSCLLRIEDDEKLMIANAGWPGGIGVVTGMSGNGFAVVLNAVLSGEPLNSRGYPVLLHVRRVLEDAKDFDSAVRMLADQELTTSALFTVIGEDNRQRVVVERSPGRHALRWPDRGRPLITTNDYRQLAKPETSDVVEIYQSTCQRFDYLTSFFENHTDKDSASDEQLLYALTEPNVIQQITAQHIIMHPRSQRIELYVPGRYLDD